MSTETRELRPGDPCPNGCRDSNEWWEPVSNRRNARIVRDGDGEMSCPECWDYFGNEADTKGEDDGVHGLQA